MKYVLINDEGLDLGNKNLVGLKTIEVTATNPKEAVLKALMRDLNPEDLSAGFKMRKELCSKLHASEYGRAPGVWLVRDDEKTPGLSLIVVERGVLRLVGQRVKRFWERR